jgi:hypothetical protein
VHWSAGIDWLTRETAFREPADESTGRACLASSPTGELIELGVSCESHISGVCERPIVVGEAAEGGIETEQRVAHWAGRSVAGDGRG